MVSRSLRLIAVIILALACVIGCSNGDGDKAEEAAADAGAAAHDAVNQAEDAVASSFDALKGAYVDSVRSSLNEFGKKVDELVARKNGLPKPIKQTLEGPVNLVQESHNDAANTLSEVEYATEENFEAMRTEMDMAMEDLKSKFEKAASMLN